MQPGPGAAVGDDRSNAFYHDQSVLVRRHLDVGQRAVIALLSRLHLQAEAVATAGREGWRLVQPGSQRKAEHTLEGANPRFVATSLKRTRLAYDARALYEDLYCARGKAGNRIGEQFELFADRASSATMQANQLRMWFSAMAYDLHPVFHAAH